MGGALIGGLTLPAIVTIVTVLGPMGLVLIMWYVDHRRYERDRTEHKADMVSVLERYDKDMRTVTRFYEDNVVLVKGYAALAGDLSTIIHLNTQVQTQLAEKISNNMFCPAVRAKGPTG